MKKLLTLLITITSISLNAQTKQNDATWEETIEFIRKYKNYFNHPVYGSIQDASDKILSINEKTILIKRFIKSKPENGREESRVSVINIPLKKMFKAEKSTATSYVPSKINLYFTGKYLKEETEYSNKTKKYSSKVYYWDQTRVFIMDSEMRPRILKAFQHLAYLATQERLEKSKGDKF